MLEQLADAIESNLEAFAQAESRDCGKPIRAARQVDVPRAIQNFRFFASLARTVSNESYQPSDQHWHTVLRQPLGVVACISPWNLPLYLLTWKLAPALATGNTVVAKPSEVTPLTASMLAELTGELGWPPGVLNIVHGRGPNAGAALVGERRIKAVSFTGSTASGRAIAEQTAASFRKLSLEMGGKNAMLVFADADLELAVRECVRAGFSNQGQICLCGSRVLVQRELMPAFRAALLAAIERLKPSDPREPECEFGALTSAAHLAKVEAAVALAEQEGGRCLIGGARIKLDGRCVDGYFFAPTVFDQLPFECRTNQEEIFGPVLTLLPFDDEQQAVAYANGTRYGLAASVFTSDIGRAQRVARALEAGLVWINCWMQRDLRLPFGGVKDSGLGREGGMDAWRFFTEAKSVSQALS